jgi:hypothetical protein
MGSTPADVTMEVGVTKARPPAARSSGEVAMDSLRDRTPEELTPSALEAVDGMRRAFVKAFRATAGPGTAPIARRAWTTWRARLLGAHGLDVAEASAYNAALAELTGRGHYAFLVWVTAARLRRATAHASAAASTSS